MTDSPEPLFEPVEEQRLALELFLKGEGLRIDAYAGTGKTTTLQLLAASTPKRGLYLAFNRSIANEGQARFPSQVKCATSHSVAFHSVRKVLGYPEWKLTGTLSANLIAESFAMPEVVSFSCGLVLPKRSYASVLLDALKQFLQSAVEIPQTSHIPRYGALRALKDEEFAGFSEQAIKHVEAIWNAMRHKTVGLPLGHDGYLKLWALSNPQARTDYIMIDEAQDLNPVLLGVLSGLQCPIVYVGDPYQQIYEWRGAVNAMDAVATKHYALLSQSFRFGPEIASAASVILRKLGARHPLRGTSTIKSNLARVRPEAILARSNAGLIANVMKSLEKGLRCAVLGGTRELERLLCGVQRMKDGSPALVSELLGFNTWREVMSFSTEPEGEYLRSLVNLVQEHGEARMLAAIARCEAVEASAQVVCSTAHRAKGREWDYVRVDDDFEAAFIRSLKSNTSRSAEKSSFASEARLLYVAMTRARSAIHLPPEIRKRFGLKNTSEAILGRASLSPEFTVQLDPAVPDSISPYRPARGDDPHEVAVLKRILTGRYHHGRPSPVIEGRRHNLL